MAFDQPTRNRLARFVGEARAVLTEEFTRQLQHEYGLDPARGEVAEVAKLTQLDDARRETARILRETLAHYLAGQPTPTAKARQEALDRIVREQAFTVLNRLCALRMAEARGIVIESIAQGYQSRGFQLYARLAGTALGETGEAYRAYLFSLFDEFAVDLAVLFDRFSPQGRLFPRASTLLQLLAAINHADLEPLWAEDETIGWIYQYFNSKEERKAMRDASQAPRNSRELAVRNQFFTPRYVVEFLTDNTLGRIWYEMTQGRTSLVDSCRYLVRRPNEIFLAEGEIEPGDRETPDTRQETGDKELSQAELLRQPVYLPFRQIKDPRTILMLDPACGSMHFGLYSFDLYERIYEEAWALEGELGAHTFERPAAMAPLRERYPDKASFLRDVPRLIIEYNIHGIDIDPRAVQIAGLSLWLRAQKSWQAQGLKPHERPTIRKSNIVCAEPMPGDKALLEEFLQGLRDDRLESLIRRVLNVPENQRVRATPTMADALCDLVRTVWEEMKLAGEAGSLLKIEESLTEAIAKGRAEWEEKMPLFRVETFRMTEEKLKVNYVKVVPGEGVDFWERAEVLVLAALEEYTEQTGNDSYQRRLFAEDAARGFSFIDLCRKRYDIVLMNPPFGNPSVEARDYLSNIYPNLWADIYSAFILRSSHLISALGKVGAITSRSFLVLSSFEILRELLVEAKPIQLAVECGLGVLDDATVRTCFFVFGSCSQSKGTAIFWDLRNSDERSSELLSSIRRQCNRLIYVINPSEFRKIPGKPFVYWLPTAIRSLLIKGPHLDPQRLFPTSTLGLAHVAVGASTTDDMRFVRCHWEVPRNAISTTGWARFAHAIGFARYYSPTYALLNWFENGRELLSVTDSRGNVKPRLRCQEYFFEKGLVSPYISERGLGCSYLPVGHIVSNSCRAFFALHCPPGALLGYLNSKLADLLIWALTPDRKHEAGIIAAIPVPQELNKIEEKLAQLSNICWHSVMMLRSLDETDPLYSVNFREWDDRIIRAESNYIDTQSEIDRIAQIDQVDSLVISNLIDLSGAPHDLGRWTSNDEELDKITPADSPGGMITALLSHSLGSALGIWDIRLSSGQLKAQLPQDPFTALPSCPPAMLQNSVDLPITFIDIATDYPLRISWSGILVDNPSHSEDIELRVREVLRVIWPDCADAIEQEACEILGVPSLRAYFANPSRFFDDHLKRYSKSRRAAPIYWPLATPSGSYTLWLYYHRLTDQTLYSCVNDFVEPKLKQVNDEVNKLRQRANRSRQEEKELDRLSDLALELAAFRDELLRIARFWQPNLNDGVQITAAPFWRLFQHRAWQKRLKETWEKLEAGDYDWAHLAYSLWPERVRAKCKTDKSLAIAHDLEHLYVEPVKPVKAKKGGRKPQPVDDDEQVELL